MATDFVSWMQFDKLGSRDLAAERKAARSFGFK